MIEDVIDDDLEEKNRSTLYHTCVRIAFDQRVLLPFNYSGNVEGFKSGGDTSREARGLFSSKIFITEVSHTIMEQCDCHRQESNATGDNGIGTCPRFVISAECFVDESESLGLGRYRFALSSPKRRLGAIMSESSKTNSRVWKRAGGTHRARVRPLLRPLPCPVIESPTCSRAPSSPQRKRCDRCEDRSQNI